MSFRDLFPWTHAFLRLLCLRGTRRAILAAASLLSVGMVGFRLESAIFQWRVRASLKTITLIKLNETTEEEMRKLMPSLILDPAEEQDRDNSLKRYSRIDSDVDYGLLIHLLKNEHGESIDRSLSAIGHRFHRYGVTALVRDGKVVRIGYFLWLDDTQDHNLYSGIGVDVMQYSRVGWDVVRDKNTISYDNLAPYVETVASNAPENSLHIRMTSDTPDAFKRAAFAVHLACLYAITGCQNTRQILPEVQPPRFPERNRNLQDSLQEPD